LFSSIHLQSFAQHFVLCRGWTKPSLTPFGGLLRSPVPQLGDGVLLHRGSRWRRGRGLDAEERMGGRQKRGSKNDQRMEGGRKPMAKSMKMLFTIVFKKIKQFLLLHQLLLIVVLQLQLLLLKLTLLMFLVMLL